MLRILFVCTGNICRSPLAELVLSQRLRDQRVSVASAGTRARIGEAMAPKAARLALLQGAEQSSVVAHRSSPLTEQHLAQADLVIALAREHRRAVVELQPSAIRRTFALREVERLLADTDCPALRQPRTSPAQVSDQQLQSLLEGVSARRGVVSLPAAAEDDDVLDPIGRSSRTFERSWNQMDRGLRLVEQLVRDALV